MILLTDEVQEVVDYIPTQAYTGDEQGVNGSVYFGIGSAVYTWADNAAAANIPAEHQRPTLQNTAFIHLSTVGVPMMLNYLLNRDGYLVVE